MKVSGRYLCFLWSYKDFRNNVVVKGFRNTGVGGLIRVVVIFSYIVMVGVVVMCLLVVDVILLCVRAYTESLRSIYLFSLEL